MMSVKEYASDVNLSVEVVLKLCGNLGISANNEDDMLDDDSIIMLDGEVANFDSSVDYNEADVDLTPRLSSATFKSLNKVLRLTFIKSMRF